MTSIANSNQSNNNNENGRPAYPRWTPAEDEVLRSLYQTATKEELRARLTGRTWKAIVCRAGTLGLGRTRLSNWSASEDAVLRKYYDELPVVEIVKRLPGRTPSSARCRATYLGIKRTRQKHWNYVSVGESAVHTLYKSNKRNAKTRGYEFKLTKKQYGDLIQQPCHYCGAAASEGNRHLVARREYFYWNGLDRVDNDKGYVIDNVVPCCPTCNVAKHNHSLEEFREWIGRAYHHMFGNE